MPAHRLRFAHLSDIHFRRQVGGDRWDLNSDLRHELEIDLQRVVGEHGPLDGILVTGDIAFSGAADQYAQAAEWLSRVIEIAQCSETAVWVVPGNHDVDRQVVRGSPTIQEFHDRLRDCEADLINDHIWRYLVSDGAGGDAFFAPIKNYNAFAARYECGVSAAKPYWEDRVGIGESGVNLRIRGLTSTIISDQTDNPDGRRLVIGLVQATIPRELDTLTMTLSHHPPSWLRDGEAVDEALRTRARIQLWGHRHIQQTRIMDGNLHLFAGAVHPERGMVQWEPRYNVLEVEVDDGAEAATTTLYPRIWRREAHAFQADFDAHGSPFQTHHLMVDRSAGGEATVGTEDVVVVAAGGPEPQRDARRSLAFGFSSLPYQRRLSIARALDLLDQDSRDMPDQRLFELVLGRAVDESRLGDLWVAVQRERGLDPQPNPFATIRHVEERGR